MATRDFVFQKALAGREDMRAIRTSARANVARIREIIAWPSTPSDSWCKGFLAGAFDAEGGYRGALRISNTDQTIIDHIVHSLEKLGFGYVIEHVWKTDANPSR